MSETFEEVLRTQDGKAYTIDLDLLRKEDFDISKRLISASRVDT